MPHWSEKQTAVNGDRKGRPETFLAYQARLYWLVHPNTPVHVIAEQFEVTTGTVSLWKKEYDWEAVYGEYRKEFLDFSMEERNQLYSEFLKENYEKSKVMMDGKVELYKCACQNLGIMDGEPKFELDKQEALSIINKINITDLHKMILRNLEVPYTINDKQDINVKQTDDRQIDDESVLKMMEGLQRALK